MEEGENIKIFGDRKTGEISTMFGKSALAVEPDSSLKKIVNHKRIGKYSVYFLEEGHPLVYNALTREKVATLKHPIRTMAWGDPQSGDPPIYLRSRWVHVVQNCLLYLNTNCQIVIVKEEDLARSPSICTILGSEIEDFCLSMHADIVTLSTKGILETHDKRIDLNDILVNKSRGRFWCTLVPINNKWLAAGWNKSASRATLILADMDNPPSSIGSEYDLRSDINYMGNSPYRFIHVCNQGREQRGRIYTVCFRTWGYYDLYLIGNNGIQAVSVDNQITRDVQDPIYAVLSLSSRSVPSIRGGGDTVLLASIEGGIIRLSHKI